MNKSLVSNFLMMLCSENYCTLLIFDRVIFKTERGGRFLRHSVVRSLCNSTVQRIFSALIHYTRKCIQYTLLLVCF